MYLDVSSNMKNLFDDKKDEKELSSKAKKNWIKYVRQLKVKASMLIQ